MVRMKLAAVLCSLVTLVASNAFASVHFTQADLQAMNIITGAGFSVGQSAATNPLAAGPTYSDSVAMRGVAGGTGQLAAGGIVYYGLSASETNTWDNTVAGGDTLSMLAFNDNNQPWEIGLWYTLESATSSPISPVGSFALINGENALGGPIPPTSAVLSLVLPATITDVHRIGVYVKNVSQGDNYHTSFTVPEATSLLVWAGLGLVSLAAGRRNRG